jgi:hypothetical protein
MAALVVAAVPEQVRHQLAVRRAEVESEIVPS